MVGALFYLFPIVGQMVGVPVVEVRGVCFGLYPVQQVQMVSVPVVCIQSNRANSKRSSCLYPIQQVQILSVPVRAFALVCIQSNRANGRCSSVGVAFVCIQSNRANGRRSSVSVCFGVYLIFYLALS